MNINKVLFLSILIYVLVAVILLMTAKYIAFQNIHKPNPEYIDIVQEHYQRHACCDETWLEMCIAFQKEMNITFDCFT